MLYYFKKGKNATEMQKKKRERETDKRFVQCMENQKWFLKFHIENSHWTMLHGWVGQLKLLEIKSRA